MTHNRIPVPADFAELAANHTRHWLRLHYRVQWRTVDRWARETRATVGKRTYNSTPPPADLAQLAPTMRKKELIAHYGTTRAIMERWLEVAGAQAKRNRRTRAEVEADKARRKASPKSRFVSPLQPRQVALPTGEDEDAAQYLRRFFVGVFHCDEHGFADPKGGLWRCGNAVLTRGELIERAERKGWDAQAWRRLAGSGVNAFNSSTSSRTPLHRHAGAGA